MKSARARRAPAGGSFCYQVAVVAIEAEGDGWLVQFDCGDIVWTPIERKIGERIYCAVCLDRLLKRVRAIRGLPKNPGTK
jgi:hypothetical protein